MRPIFSMIIVVMLLLAVLPANAQPPPIAIGENKIGELSAAVSKSNFVFSAAAGQIIEVEVLAITEGLAPLLTVLNQNGALVQAIGNPESSNQVSGTINFQQAGNYMLEVSSANNVFGQFVIIVSSAVPTVPPTPLQVNVPATGSLTPGSSLVYGFVGLDTPVQLTITWTNTTSFLVQAELKNNTGDTLALISSALSSASFILRPGATPYTVALSNNDLAPTEYQLSLVIADVDITSTEEPSNVELPILPTTGACVLATAENVRVNIRSGPGQAYDPPIGGMSTQVIYNVIGRNSDSSWYKISHSGGEGWVGSGVTRRGGDCSNVPVVAAPPLPTSSTQVATPTGTIFTATPSPTGTIYTATPSSTTDPNVTPTWTPTWTSTWTPTWTPTP